MIKNTSRFYLGSSVSKRCKALTMTAIWSYATVWCVLPLLGFGRYAVDGIGTSCTFDYLATDGINRTFVVVLFVGGFLLPVGVIVVSYCIIFYTLSRHRQFLRRELGNSSQLASAGIKPVDVRLVFMSVAVLVLFCVAWLPYSCIALVGLSGGRHLISPYASLVLALLAKSSSVYNPILYTVSYRRFRRQMMRSVLPCANKGHSSHHVELLTRSKCLKTLGTDQGVTDSRHK